MNSEVVLEWRMPGQGPVKRWTISKMMWVVVGSLLLLIAFAFAVLIYLALILGKIDALDVAGLNQLWGLYREVADRLGTQIKAAPWQQWIEPVMLMLVLPSVLLAQTWSARRQVRIGSDLLNLDSGLPAWLDRGPWASWTLSLKDIASVDLINALAHSGGHAPLQFTALRLKDSSGKLLRQLPVVPWHRLEEGKRPRLKSSSTWLGIETGSWKSHEDQRMLGAAFDALPLVFELRKRGVNVPPLAQARKSGGPDLFASSRMKALVIATFTLGPVYFVGAFLPREHWVVAPAFMFWAAVGLAFALVAMWWMRSERRGDLGQSLPESTFTQLDSPAGRPVAMDGPTLLGHQSLVSLLFGLSAAAAAYPCVPMLNRLLFPAQEIEYRVGGDAVLLPTDESNASPRFRPTESRDFWSSRAPSARYKLMLRRLPLGYWQYNVDGLSAEIEAFDRTARR